MTTSCCVTVVAGNYLAYAAVLAASLRQHDEAWQFQVLVVERASPGLRALAASLNLSVVFVDELGLPDLERLAYKYDILELSTALKPSFLKRVFSQGFDRVVYLDPDIRLYGDLGPVREALDGAAIVLTPHILSPLLDGRRPSEVDFLRNGVFNLGFIGLAKHEQTSAMLDWWEARCLGLGFNDPGFGTFVDQKWADLMPALFEATRILRHPGCNVAYWNLHERQLARAASGVLVNGRPLVFFHFSGVDAAQPEHLSRHQDRFDLVAGTPLAELVGGYCEALLAAGHAQLRQHPYSFACLDDGTPISPTMRRALLCSVGQGEAQPFRTASEFQRRLRASGIAHRGDAGKPEVVNTRNLHRQAGRQRWVDRSVRLLARLFGPERTLMLLRYAAVLTRESHFASVLLGVAQSYEHREKR
ncbi:hypothetical protein J7U46_05640 [Pelomonas sp. V22]|uniref:hypothetical protein n=1 Tax=Pelomonas sp. V22 TaxID=2822139 RepID=UPI0024A80521|nr:hypothetical protein [Pelomonas sp. V22]MDI4632520.1 hypothetical protein [Pelomonas sp. V22]